MCKKSSLPARQAASLPIEALRAALSIAFALVLTSGLAACNLTASPPASTPATTCCSAPTPNVTPAPEQPATRTPMALLTPTSTAELQTLTPVTEELPTVGATIALSTVLPSLPSSTASNLTMQPLTTTESVTDSNSTAASYFIYPKTDGSLWRTTGQGRPVLLAPATEPNVSLPWAASPDGRTIAYVSGVGVWDYSPPGVKPQLALWMVGADGSNRRKIQDLLPPRKVDTTPGSGDEFDLLPSLIVDQALEWSPDGSLLAFVSAHERMEGGDLYVATPGGSIRRITNTSQLERGPMWSPDSLRVAYYTASGFGSGVAWADLGLGVSRRDGGKPLLVKNSFNLSVGGQASIMHSFAWTGPDAIVVELQAAPSDNSEVQALTVSTGKTVPLLSSKEAGIGLMSWSEEGKRLAITGTPPDQVGIPGVGKPGVYIWQPGKTRALPITGEPVETFGWSPRGDALMYVVPQGGHEPGMYVWSAASGKAKRIVAGDVGNPGWSPDGQNLLVDVTLYSRDGRKLKKLPMSVGTGMVSWEPQGIFFYVTDKTANDTSLWFWDNNQARQLDTGLLFYMGGE